MKTISEAVRNSEKFLAHISGDRKESLEAHSELTYRYFERITKDKQLMPLIENLAYKISGQHAALIVNMFGAAVFYHDLGKINHGFQRFRMQNAAFTGSSETTGHSSLSALLYMNLFYDDVRAVDKPEKKLIKHVLCVFSAQIASHHGRLKDYNVPQLSQNLIELNTPAYTDSFALLSDMPMNDDKSFMSYSWRPDDKYYEIYTMAKLLHSLIVSCDYYATAQFMSGYTPEGFGVFNNALKKRFSECLEKSPIVKSVRSGSADTEINHLRGLMFLEAEQNITKNADKRMFYLEAPTGCGKTITSLNLASRLLNMTNADKIFYVFPFNTLADQTCGVFRDLAGGSVPFHLLNSVSPISADGDENTDYGKSYFDRLTINYPVVFTSHVRLFSMLFGTGKEANMPLWQMANSIVIIDELQSYGVRLWQNMAGFLASYAELLNIRFIVMSATLPRIDRLLETSCFTELADSGKYYESTVFRDRVKPDFSMLTSGKITLEALLDKFRETALSHRKILVEFIKKKTAGEFYDMVKDNLKAEGFEVYLLTGDDNKLFREKIIRRTKDDVKIVIIATQVIEAGVDIDMEAGFKDTSFLDSEEQFLGRINRNSRGTGTAYFFDHDDAKSVYDKLDYRLLYSLNDERMRHMLAEKDFAGYYSLILQKAEEDGNSFRLNASATNMDNFKHEISGLQFASIQKGMELIEEQNTFQLFFPFDMDVSGYNGLMPQGADEFITDGVINGSAVWKRFKELNEIDEFVKKKVKLADFMPIFRLFTFDIYARGAAEPHSYNEHIGGFYYVDDYEPYITEEYRLDRKAYDKGELFL